MCSAPNSSTFIFSTLTTILIFLILPTEISSNTMWGKGFPAITMDYKVVLYPQKDFCYFQHIEADSVFHVEFQVIRGGDLQASFVIKDPNGEVVLPHGWKQRANYNTENSVGGYYSICVYNQYSRYDEIVVSIFMSAYANGGWSKYIEELEALHVSGQNCTNILGATEARMSDILKYLYHTKSSEARDFGMLLNNNYNVSLWSFIHCLIIFTSSTVNVFFIRKLFHEKPATGKYQARL